MTFDALTPEQGMLRDALQRWLRERPPAPHLPDAHRPEDDAALWRGLAELGVTTLLAPEEAEALGGSLAEVKLTLEALGAAAVTSPFIEHAVLAMQALRTAEAAPGVAPWLDRMQRGEVLLSIAFDEAGQRGGQGGDWHAAQASATHSVDSSPDNSVRFQGVKTLVRHADTANALLVTARLDGEPAVWLLPRAAWQDTALLQRRRSLDAAPVADLRLPASPVPALLLAQGVAATALIEQLRGWHLAALCAWGVGAMDAACALTARYLGERHQFGQPLAQFQVLRHRFIDMRIQLLKAQAMAAQALAVAGEGDSPLRREVLACAKITVSEAARCISQQAIQLHGAMGLTAEYGLGPLVRLLSSVALRGGGVDAHLASLAKQ